MQKIQGAQNIKILNKNGIWLCTCVLTSLALTLVIFTFKKQNRPSECIRGVCFKYICASEILDHNVWSKTWTLSNSSSGQTTLEPDFLRVWLWAFCLTSLCFSFLICRTEIRILPSLLTGWPHNLSKQGQLWEWKMVLTDNTTLWCYLLQNRSALAKLSCKKWQKHSVVNFQTLNRKTAQPLFCFLSIEPMIFHVFHWSHQVVA